MTLQNIPALLKWNLLTYRSYFINKLIAPALAMFALLLLESGFLTQQDCITSNVDWPAIIFFFAFSYLSACHMLVNIKDDNARAQFLLLPAGQGEKFLTRWLLCVVGQPIMTLMGYLVGYASFALLQVLIHQTFVDIPGLFYESWAWETNLTLYVLMVSTAVLGSALFRRSAPFMVVIALIALALLLVAQAMGLLWLIDRAGYVIIVEPWWIDLELGWIEDLVAGLLLLAYVALCHWGAYRLFCRLQLKSRRFLNF